MRPRPLVKLGDARLLCAMTTWGDGYFPSRPTWTHQVNPDGPPSTEARLATGIRTYGYTNTLDAEHQSNTPRHCAPTSETV
ncbi:hypothetical protein [Streptomyces sp. NBC_01483]|uniref:hypothetical protein n=1 Tax=Streptomyces sp. NBC_01483 TaxID=2903883 RepID=UPI002E375E5B|nr:hypothetical protein [Streptomyces sp. NBC_01483]